MNVRTSDSLPILDPIEAQTHRHRRIAWLAIGASLVLVFVVPTFFPPPPAWSDSYAFGFNNRIAQALFGLTLFLTAVFAGLGWLALPSPQWTTTAGAKSSGRRLLIVCMAIATVLAVFVAWLTASAGGINDSVYFLDRIHLMERGQVPVRDFEFMYGSGPLYGAVGLSRLFPISASSGYFAIWTVSTLLGIFFIWLAIRWLDLPERGKRVTFLMTFAVFAYMIFMGTLNYCAMRYALSLFGVVALSRIDGENHIRARISVIAFVALIVGLLLSYTPEQGLVYAVAVCVYLPVRRIILRRPFLPDLLGILGAIAVLLAMAARMGTFVTMKQMNNGAMSLPVYPSLLILFVFAAMLVVVAFLTTDLFRQPRLTFEALRTSRAAERLQSNVGLATIYSIGMIPGALARCDSWHLVGYLLPVVLCAFLITAAWPEPWHKVFRPAAGVYLLCFVVLPAYILIVLFPPTLSKAFLSHIYSNGGPQSRFAIDADRLAGMAAAKVLGPQRGAAKMAIFRNVAGGSSRDPHALFPHSSSVVEAPFEYLPNGLNNYQAPWVEEGYFMGTLAVFTPADVAKKIEELEAHPERDLIVSPAQLASCDASVDERSWVRQLLMLPWVPRQKKGIDLLVPYRAYLEEHYAYVVDPSPATFGYGLMRRK